MKKIREHSMQITSTEKDAAKAFSEYLEIPVEPNLVKLLSHNVHDCKVFGLQIVNTTYLCYASSNTDFRISTITW